MGSNPDAHSRPDPITQERLKRNRVAREPVPQIREEIATKQRSCKGI